MQSLWMQCKWEVMRQVRNRRFLIFTIALPLFFYFIYVHLVGSNEEVSGAAWKAYYMMSMAAFAVVGGSLNGLSSRVAFERRQGFLRLVQTTPLTASAYTTAKVLSQLMLSVLMVLLLFAAGGFVEGVRMPVAHWVIAGVGLSIAALPFIAIGLCIGIVAGIEAAQVISSGLYFLLSIAGGLWFPVTIMPSWLQDAAKWLPTYRMADLGWRTAAAKPIPLSDFAVLAAYFVVVFGLILWMMRRMEPETA